MARPDILVVYGASTKAIDAANKKLRKDFSAVGKAATRIFAGAAGATAGLALYTKSVIDNIVATDRWAQALGIPIEQLSAMNYATKTVGISAGQTADRLKDLGEKIGTALAEKGGEGFKALKKLNLSVEEMNKLNPADQLLEIAKALDDVQTRGEKLDILEQISEDLTLWLPLLDDSGKGLRDLMKEAKDLGTTFDKELAEKAARAKAEMRRFDAVMSSFGMALAEHIIPALTEVVKGLTVIAGPVGKAAAKVIDIIQINAQWFTAYQSGHISFWEWFIADDKAIARLREAGLLINNIKEDITDLPPINVFGKIGGGVDEYTESLERNQDAAKDFLDGMIDQIMVLEHGQRSLDRWNALLIASAEGVLPDTARAIVKTIDALWKLEDAKEAQLLIDKKIKEQTDKNEQAARELGFTFSSAFEDAIIEGEKLSKVLQGLAQDIARIFLRKTVTEPLGAEFSKLFSGLNLGNLFSGLASGGPVSAGHPYIVGERGPELMVPGASGSVVPAGKFGGVTVSNNFDFRGAGPGVVMQLRAEAARIVQQSVAATVAAIEQGGAAARVVGRRA